MRGFRSNLIRQQIAIAIRLPTRTKCVCAGFMISLAGIIKSQSRSQRSQRGDAFPSMTIAHQPKCQSVGCELQKVFIVMNTVLCPVVVVVMVFFFSCVCRVMSGTCCVQCGLPSPAFLLSVAAAGLGGLNVANRTTQHARMYGILLLCT